MVKVWACIFKLTLGVLLLAQNAVSFTINPVGGNSLDKWAFSMRSKSPASPRRSKRIQAAKGQDVFPSQGTNMDALMASGSSESSGGSTVEPTRPTSGFRRMIKTLEDTVNEGMEVFVRRCPRPIMRIIAAVLFWPTLWWNQALKKSSGADGQARNWYDTIVPGLVCGALPYEALVPEMRAKGVTHVLNMVAEWGGPQRAYAAAGIVQKRIRVIDFTPPTLQDIEEGVAFVKEVMDAGGSVYVHCKAGRGRAASICMGFLIQHRGMSPLEAQEFLTARRPHVLQVLHRRPVIHEFARKWRPGT
mmetsp:Transcript_9921/g.21209  ORF Transcript_9921/g.21209 Transcript_9921/m.21209 type:complete len:303 (-) Transcript_9921:60-968(-)